jgi:hypothetical protein
VVGFVVAEDEKDSAELSDLFLEEGEAIVLVRGNVTDVAQQCQIGRFWSDLEDVVAFWSLQVEV